MSLQQKLDSISREFKEKMAPTLPEGTIETMQSFQQRVADMHLEDATLKAGETFPDFRLPEGRGGEVSLRGVLAAGPAAVLFFRGKW